jgi:hypothetical protein
MTPRMRRDFEARWPELALRVDSLLRRKRVPENQRDDILQETALRLIQMWGRVDVRRAPSLAVTVALNLLRDESRRRSSIEIVGDLPEIVEPLDVEAAGLARVELDQLRTAMTQLSAPQRSALLREIGNGNGHEGTSDAEKMLRLRARKKLRASLERVSAPLLLKLRKAADFLHVAGAGSQENLLQGLACVGCIAIGLGVAAPQGLLTDHEIRNPVISEQVAVTAGEAPAFEDSLGRARGTAAIARPATTPPRADNVLPSPVKKNAPETSGADRPTGSPNPAQPELPATGSTPDGATPGLPVDEPGTDIDDPAVPDTPEGDAPGRVDPGKEIPSLPDLPRVDLPNPQPPALPE